MTRIIYNFSSISLKFALQAFRVIISVSSSMKKKTSSVLLHAPVLISIPWSQDIVTAFVDYKQLFQLQDDGMTIKKKNLLSSKPKNKW